MAEIQEHDLNPLLNSFNEGVCCINAQGELIHYNSAALAHWNIDQPHTHKLTLQPPIARALAGEYVNHELVHLGNQHDLLINTLPLYAGTNTVTSIVVISQNVSEHVILQQQAQVALNVLLEATLATHDTNDTDETLRRVAALIPQLEGVDNSVAFRIDEATGKLNPVALFSSSEKSYKQWQEELAEIELNTEHTLQRSVPAYMHTLHLARPLMFDFSVPTNAYNNPRNLVAAIYAPVLLDGHVIGLLGAERSQPAEDKQPYFPPWGVDLLTALARLASMSIEKTALLSSANRLQQDAESLRTMLNQKEELLLLASHELKNPLTAIRGHVQIFRRRLERSSRLATGDVEVKHDLLRSLESVERQTYTIEHMINTLLDVSRSDLDRLELKVQAIDLTQLLKRTLKDYLPLAPQHKLRLFIEGKSVPIQTKKKNTDPPIHVQGDEHRLEQIIINLVSNAIKYSPVGSIVTVSLRRVDNDYVEFTVEDQGIGIPPEEQAQLTQRYYRAKNAQAINSKGLGLGLYLVNTLVASHGGSISIKSPGIPGKGSIFTVRLPQL